ncbi:hypothetical protein C8046_08550 [Serinibacter arcticus]|uniref:Uncharacterized protein n=1 Tax=Serinibacter arcticus TaxID=1655435 RepID=A0A2U1ZUN2_9MICO|nr:hypothetical protein [Serinibacter arcticus]PWD50695.1 hypothetical protein C8046_08550 [Serinibacter arcticus]
MSHALPRDLSRAHVPEHEAAVTPFPLTPTRPAEDPGPGRRAGGPIDPVEAEHTLAQTRDEVGARLIDVCAVLDTESRIEVRWIAGAHPGTVAAVAATHAPVELTAEEVARQLSTLGWRVRFTSRSPVPCLDAGDAGHALRAVIHEGRALLTLRGADVAVGPRRSRQLVAPEGGSRS